MKKQDLGINRIYDFEKNSQRVGIDSITVNVKGEDKIYCGIRELYKGPEDQWLPSTKGVTFSGEYVSNILPMVTEAEELDPYPEGGIVLGEIPKNSTELIKVTATKYKDKEYLDFRIYFMKDGEYHPTKKGVTIPPDCLPSLKEGLEKFIGN